MSAIEQPISDRTVTRQAQGARTSSGRRQTRARRGAYVVEFAVVAPVAFLLIFGIFEFGRLMMVQHALNGAARIACRKASLANSTSATTVDTTARNAMAGVLAPATASNTGKMRVTITPASLTGVASGTAM